MSDWQELTLEEYAALPAPEVQLAAGIAMVYSRAQDEMAEGDDLLNPESLAVIEHNGDESFSITPGPGSHRPFVGRRFIVTVTSEEV